MTGPWVHDSHWHPSRGPLRWLEVVRVTDRAVVVDDGGIELELDVRDVHVAVDPQGPPATCPVCRSYVEDARANLAGSRMTLAGIW